MSQSLQQSLKNIGDEATKAFEQAQDSQSLYQLKVQFMGKNGSLSQLMKEMKNLSNEERPLFGKLVNEVKDQLEARYSAQEERIKRKELEDKLR